MTLTLVTFKIRARSPKFKLIQLLYIEAKSTLDNFVAFCTHILKIDQFDEPNKYPLSHMPLENKRLTVTVNADPDI